jgi:peptide/nickel transport system ATP-binding protein
VNAAPLRTDGPRTDGPILEVTDLGVDFWVAGKWIPAAEKVNFTLSPGQVLAIVGESGSGKTTRSMALERSFIRQREARG